MQLTNDMKNSINAIKSSLDGINKNAVTTTRDQLQHSTKNCTVIFGLHSLRLSIVNNIDNTAMVITPCNIQNENGVYLHHMGTVFHIFNNEENIVKEYNTLNVDSGELFQMGTVNDCNFTDNEEVLPLLLGIITNLEKLSVTTYNKYDVPQAVLNITEAMEKYKAVT
jgi:hypothetical protein